MKRINSLLIEGISAVIVVLGFTTLHCQFDPNNLLGGGSARTMHVINTIPSDGQTNVTVNTDIRAAFDAHIDDTTLNYRTFFVGNPELGDVDGTLTLQRSTDTVIFTPTKTFQPGKEYVVTITTGLRGTEGEKLDQDYRFRFTTSSSSSPSSPSNPAEPSNPSQPTNPSCVYVSSSGSPSNTGLSPTSPLLTITAGIAKAQQQGIDRVLVSQGTYNEQVTMVEGISLYGGYSSDFSTYNPTVYVTTLKDPSTSGGSGENPNFAVKAGSGITRATVLEGFRIQGGGGTLTVGVLCQGGSPTIQNNVIDGGTGYDSYGIRNSNCAPLIQYNTITGGTASHYTCGVGNVTSSSITQYNRIDGGTAGEISVGVYNSGKPDPAPLIRNNHIDGGYGGYADSIAVYIRWPGNGIVLNNTIHGGRAAWSHGFRIQDAASSAIIRNNTIDSGTGSSSAICIRLQDGPTVTIENNIIMSSRSIGRGIYNWSGSPIITQANNVFAGCASGTNTDYGNVVYSSYTNLYLTDYAGGDWHLTGSTPATVRQGGLDGAASGWGFNTDKDGNPRTGNGSTGWSIGAYEKD
ncbi:MAG: hypothetical protein Kow009_08110 [Spirochaetales bacterium]